MWGLKQARRRRHDAGAVAVIVSVLVATGVLIGSLAISVDIGSIMSERRQLQNGADASSMALAQLCAANDALCSDANAATAVKPLAKANAKDNLTAISSVCAANVTGITATCETPDAANLAKCNPKPGWMAATLPYVEVKTKTESTSGSTVLTPFAKALTSSAGSTVYSCARAAWGIPGSYAASVPIVISECEWKAETSNGAVYQAGPGSPAPGYGTLPGQTPWPPTSAERTLMLKSTGAANCAINGKDTAGGFGYVIDSSSGDCQAQVTTDNWAPIDTGSSAPSGCNSIIDGLRGTVINLPIFDCLVKQNDQPTGGIGGYSDCTGSAAGGAKSWYHIQGWAKFYLSGYKIGGSQEKPSYLTGSVPCTGGDRCLSGWFVSGTLSLKPGSTVTPPTGNNNFGAYQVIPAG